ILRLDARLIQDGAQVVAGAQVADVEDRRDPGAGGPGADQICGDARTEDGTEGIDDDRLAGAGLAGQGVEAGAEADPEVADDGEIADGKFEEHGCLLDLLPVVACCASAGWPARRSTPHAVDGRANCTPGGGAVLWGGGAAGGAP